MITRGKGEQALVNFDKIRQLTTRMADQISHIRRFARRPDVKQQAVDLCKSVREALSLLEHRFEDDDVRLKLELPVSDCPLVMAEPVRLEQVIVNLIANALDAVKDQPVRQVSVTVEATENGANLIIADTGTGIESDHLKAVFDPFFTTKPVGSGLGLGLSISYNIVKDFGASIAVLDTGPHGTRFIVLLKGPE